MDIFRLNRWHDESNQFESEIKSAEVFFPKEHGTGIIFDKIRITSDFVLSNRKLADSWFLVKDQLSNFEIVKFMFVKYSDGIYKIFGKQIDNKKEFFRNPLNSTKLHIFESDGKLVKELKIYDISSICAKMFHVPYEDKFVFMPIVHTYK